MNAEEFSALCSDALGSDWKRQLVTLVGVDRSTVTRWLNGSTKLPRWAIFAIKYVRDKNKSNQVSYWESDLFCLFKDIHVASKNVADADAKASKLREELYKTIEKFGVTIRLNKDGTIIRNAFLNDYGNGPEWDWIFPIRIFRDMDRIPSESATIIEKQKCDVIPIMKMSMALPELPALD